MKSDPFIIIGDNHGDQIDYTTTKALFAHIDDFKPTIRIHLGDNWDFRNLRKGASDDEKAGSLEDDWTSGCEFLREFFDGGRQNYFLRGNHDERIYRLQSSAVGVMRDYASDCVKRLEGVVKRAKAQMLPYDSRLGILRVGHLKGVHGYFSGRNAMSRHAAVYGNVICGHIHTIESYPVESDNGPMEARSVGCICKIDMDYNQHMPNKLRHRNGWSYGHLFSDGTYQIYQTTRIGDHFYAAKEITQY